VELYLHSLNTPSWRGAQYEVFPKVSGLAAWRENYKCLLRYRLSPEISVYTLVFVTGEQTS
jgi:hypothetical protein